MAAVQVEVSVGSTGVVGTALATVVAEGRVGCPEDWEATVAAADWETPAAALGWEAGWEAAGSRPQTRGSTGQMQWCHRQQQDQPPIDQALHSLKGPREARLLPRLRQPKRHRHPPRPQLRNLRPHPRWQEG